MRRDELRRRVHDLLEDDDRNAPGRWAADAVVMTLIGVSVLGSILSTVAQLDRAWGWLFAAIELVCLPAFTVEYLLRVWCAVEDRAERYRHPVLGRLRFMATPMAIVDLLAVLPAYLVWLFPIDTLFLRAFRLIRLLKVTRYSPALATLEVVFVNERRALLSAAHVMLIMLVLASSLVYLAERDAQPEVFSSIPAAMWWGMATLTTVGYGDVVPVTPLGKLLGACVSLFGIGMFALPAAILATGFGRERSKQDFGMTLAMVARVPLFGQLPPAQLAEVTALLQPRVLPPRYTVLHRGEHADAMYFIADGEVASHGERGRRLGPGEFFGEVSLIKGGQVGATVTTVTSCRLLELNASDFHRLVGGDTRLSAAILEEVRKTDPEAYDGLEKKESNDS